MSGKQTKVGNWNAARVLHALGRIGYHPVSAILDITDNSLSADANDIAVRIERVVADRKGPGRRRAIIKSFTIIDNGNGMDEEGLDNALTLGSSQEFYSQNTLSKFGMGLKTAAFSLGRRLEIISRRQINGIAKKVVLDYDQIIESQVGYVYDIEEPNDDDISELDEICKGSSGTLVRITKIHDESMPSISEIMQRLKQRAGIVYYYYILGQAKEEKLNITIDGEVVVPFDPLFVSEAKGDLDENLWNGIEVKWITHNKPIPLDENSTIFADLEITQLPHPPSVADAGLMSRQECLDNYMIDAGAYGFYVYRNYRLISWPEDTPVKLSGERTKASDLYAFRGRLLISSDADDLLNIDVTKSRIQLSETANDFLKPEIREAMRKSRAAWNNRSRTLIEKLGTSVRTIVNQEIDQAEKLAQKDDQIDEEVVAPDEKAKLEKRRKTATEKKKAEQDEEKRLREEGERVQVIEALFNNQLWERAHDPTNGIIARVNASHRFYRDILLERFDNPDLVRAVSILLFGLARGEYDLIYKSETVDENLAEKIMQEYRERVGAVLSDMLRRMNTSTVFDE